MKPVPFSKIRSIVIFVSLLILSGGIGYRLGDRGTRLSVTSENKIVVNQNPPPQVTVNFSLFWDVWQRLFRSYIDASEMDPQKMVEGAITGMVASLGDPYTTYLPPKENNEFKEDLAGNFEGIGAQLGLKENRIIVVAPLKGAPAEKAGLLPSDWILKVEGEETYGWTVPQAVTKIRGKKGTSVKLQILHENEQKPKDVTIVRDTISIPSVVSWVKSPRDIPEISGTDTYQKLSSLTSKIAYLQLNRFGDNTNDEWGKAVDEILSLKKGNGSFKGLVFDLRNNPGGYLDGAVFIASEFIKSGVVVSQVNSDGGKIDYQVNRKGKLIDIPVVVLVNKGSASAAEIVAGALRDHKRATIVGETTYGKGSVQSPQELPGGGSLHVTTGKWLTPHGDSIHKQGIKPSVEISLEDTEATRDAQLARAVELLLL